MKRTGIDRRVAVKKVVYVVPILTPYAIARFQVLAKEMGIDLHVIVEKSRTDERNGSR